MGMALKGPTGAALLIQDGAGDDPDMVNITYSLADSRRHRFAEDDRMGSGNLPADHLLHRRFIPCPRPLNGLRKPGTDRRRHGHIRFDI